jgi:hypothetical protein
MGNISKSTLYKEVSRPFPISLPFLSFKSTTKLEPVGSGLIDVVNSFKWKNYGSASEVPSILLDEYELSFGTWAANLARLMKIYNESGNLDPYLPLYSVDNKNTNRFKYHIPYLLGDGAKIRTIQNEWGKFEGGIDKMFKSTRGGKLDTLGQVAGFVASGLTPGIGFEEIYEYKNTSLEEITVTFPLYNTGSVTDAYKNYNFVTLLTFQNLKTRTSFLTYIPPRIYTVSTNNCLGGLYWPVAVISRLSIESIGTTRELNEFGGRPILMPEAFKISITLKQIVSNSSNIFEGAVGGTKVDVTVVAKDEAQEIFNNIANYFS